MSMLALSNGELKTREFQNKFMFPKQWTAGARECKQEKSTIIIKHFKINQFDYSFNCLYFSYIVINGF